MPDCIILGAGAAGLVTRTLARDWLADRGMTTMMGPGGYSNATHEAYQAVLIDEEGVECATASVELPEKLPPPPQFRGDPRQPVGPLANMILYDAVHQSTTSNSAHSSGSELLPIQA